MTTQTNAEQDYGVEIGVTKIKTPYEGRHSIFVSPAEGPGTYSNTMKGLLDRGLKPSGGNISALVHAVYCGPEEVEGKPFRDSPPVTNVKGIMQDNWIWVARIKLWTPQGFGKLGAGVFSIYDERGVGLSEELDVSRLEEELGNSVELRKGVISTPDGKVRFASESTYALEDHTHDSLKDDGNVITDYGIDGARRLSEVSEAIGGNPYVYGLDVSQLKKPEQRVSALGGGDGRLHVDGYYFGGYGGGRAFGVLE